MPKIEVSKVAEICKKQQIDPALLRKIVEEMLLAVQPESTDEAPPAVKKQFVILISDPDSLLPRTDFAGWVLKLPESESPATVVDRIHRATYDYNATKKGQLLPCRTVGEALENIPSRFFKELDLAVKTKTPVLMLRTDNEVPGTNPTEKLRRVA